MYFDITAHQCANSCSVTFTHGLHRQKWYFNSLHVEVMTCRGQECSISIVLKKCQTEKELALEFVARETQAVWFNMCRHAGEAIWGSELKREVENEGGRYVGKGRKTCKEWYRGGRNDLERSAGKGRKCSSLPMGPFSCIRPHYLSPNSA